MQKENLELFLKEMIIMIINNKALFIYLYYLNILYIKYI